MRWVSNLYGGLEWKEDQQLFLERSTLVISHEMDGDEELAVSMVSGVPLGAVVMTTAERVVFEEPSIPIRSLTKTRDFPRAGGLGDRTYNCVSLRVL